MRAWIIWIICLVSFMQGLKAESGAVMSNQPRYVPKKAFGQPGFNAEMVMETVGQFMTYLRDDEAGEAYQRCTSRKYRALTSWETFWCFVNQYPNFTAELSIELEGVTFKDGYALLTAFLLNDENEKEFYLEAHHEMEGSRWKIMGMKLIYLKAKENQNIRQMSQSALR